MTNRPDPRAIVMEGPPGISAGEVLRLRDTGIEIVAGFGPGRPGAPRSIRHGRIETKADAEAALLAALAGHGLVIEAPVASTVIDRLVGDLGRLGPVDHRVPDAVVDALPDTVAPLGAPTLALLHLLAEGRTLGQAATALGLSRRTADRRMAAARRALGVDRTTEAIARARRAGWLPTRQREAP